MEEESYDEVVGIYGGDLRSILANISDVEEAVINLTKVVELLREELKEWREESKGK